MILGINPFVNAQGIQAVARLDSSKIMIGDQVKLNLEVTHDPTQKVKFPAIKDSIHKIEILSKSKIDTVKAENSGLIIEKQQWVITAFDSGYFPIPPLRFVLNNDTNKITETEALLLSVAAPKVDTTQAIKEIKKPMEAPFSWKDFLPWIISVWLVIGLILGIYFYLKNRKKPVEVQEELIPSRPAHEIALEELKKLEEEKLWQTRENGVKIYYIRLSDIVRTYIEQRFGIPAMELTTDEIIESFNRIPVKEELKYKLKQLLQLSDLVKFAKVLPLPNEHELSLQNSYDFVKETIPVENEKRDVGEERKEEDQ